MIRFEHTEVFGWRAAIRGMRNALESWDRSDSRHCWNMPDCMTCPRYASEDACVWPDTGVNYVLGENDLGLMKRLVSAGPDHGKFMRYLVVQLDITAPLYWWKEYDTYKVGTVANSCSTMHKIHARDLTLEDFSCEHLVEGGQTALARVLSVINEARDLHNHFEEYAAKDELNSEITGKKTAWWQMIQLLPSSFNQKRTVSLNYQVIRSMYHARKNHKLDEWHDFCRWAESLPYSELITL